jgi:uncharacterized membrane protein
MTFSASERGALSTFMAVIAFALLMSAGLAVDGGRKVNALREASHLADNAARAGAQAVDLDTLRSTGQLRLLPDQATTQVDQYLERLGHTGDVSVAGDTITVTISLTVNPILLPTGPITVTATETATAITQEP